MANYRIFPQLNKKGPSLVTRVKRGVSEFQAQTTTPAVKSAYAPETREVFGIKTPEEEEEAEADWRKWKGMPVSLKKATYPRTLTAPVEATAMVVRAGIRKVTDFLTDLQLKETSKLREKRTGQKAWWQIDLKEFKKSWFDYLREKENISSFRRV